ncbi:MAG: hypothetical protein HPY50_03980 [Firmicutes bacterium]|nr:hypothetical protein [Bacillota bacterium]
MNLIEILAFILMFAAAKKLKRELDLGYIPKPVQDEVTDNSGPVTGPITPMDIFPPYNSASDTPMAGEPTSDVQFTAGGGFSFLQPFPGKSPLPNPAPTCRLPVPTYPEFVSLVERNVFVSSKVRFSAPRDVAHLKTFTFMVINEADSPVTGQVEMSPDGVVWESYGEPEITIAPGDSHVFVPLIFLRHTRIKYKTDLVGSTSFITIWFQGQT